jgi:hypothetical protein
MTGERTIVGDPIFAVHPVSGSKGMNRSEDDWGNPMEQILQLLRT